MNLTKIVTIALFSLASAAIISAQSPPLNVSASAGPGTSLSSNRSLAISVPVSSNVTLSYISNDTRGGAFGSYCATNGGSCQGSLLDTVSIGGKSVTLSGPYSVSSSGAVVFTVANSGPCGTAATCTFTLAPGNYTLDANMSDTFEGTAGAATSPYTETLTAVLTVNSGSVNPAQGAPPFPDPSICPIKGGLKSFVLEDQLFPTSFQTTFTASLSAGAIAAFSDPTKEVHTHFTFDTTSMVFRADSIPLPLGSAPMTPSTYDFAGNSIATVIVQIDKVYAICSPRPTIMVSGPITGGSPVFGSLLGVPHSFSFSFDPTNTANVNNAANVTISDGGANVVSSFVASAVVRGAAVSATVTGAPTINTAYRDIVLDGSQSLSVSGGMTYQWSSPGLAVGLLEPVSPMTRVKIGGPAGDYPVTLTVSTPTDTASTTVTVHYEPAK